MSLTVENDVESQMNKRRYVGFICDSVKMLSILLLLKLSSTSSSPIFLMIDSCGRCTPRIQNIGCPLRLLHRSSVRETCSPRVCRGSSMRCVKANRFSRWMRRAPKYIDVKRSGNLRDSLNEVFTPYITDWFSVLENNRL